MRKPTQRKKVKKRVVESSNYNKSRAVHRELENVSTAPSQVRQHEEEKRKTIPIRKKGAAFPGRKNAKKIGNERRRGKGKLTRGPLFIGPAEKDNTAKGGKDQTPKRRKLFLRGN